MSDFKLYVFIGIIVAVIGGFIGGAGAASGEIGGAMIILYLTSGLAAIIILWGFAGVFDQINENTERIAELMDYLTDKLDDEETEENIKNTRSSKVIEGPGASMTDAEIKKAVILYTSETGSVDELVELLMDKYPGLTADRVIRSISEVDRKLLSGDMKS